MKSLVEFIKESTLSFVYYLALAEPNQKEELSKLEKKCTTSKKFGPDQENVTAFLLRGEEAYDAYEELTDKGIPFFEIKYKGDVRHILTKLFKEIYPGEDDNLVEVKSSDEIKR